MNVTKYTLTVLFACALVNAQAAQELLPASPPRSETGPMHEPPPQAYADCLGKKANDAILHTTREGKVAAICEDSPKGLVARPKQAGGAQSGTSKK